MPNCLRWFWHFTRRADSRAACTAGSSRATSTPIIAMTTSNSTSVKPVRPRWSWAIMAEFLKGLIPRAVTVGPPEGRCQANAANSQRGELLLDQAFLHLFLSVFELELAVRVRVAAECPKLEQAFGRADFAEHFAGITVQGVIACADMLPNDLFGIGSHLG